MSRRADTTLILVTDKVVVRADVFGSGTVAIRHGVQVQERHAESSLPDCVRQAFDSRQPAGRRVVIMASCVWNQIVTLPAASVDGLDNQELAEALKFEVEPLVGIDADAARIGFAPLDTGKDGKRFWTNVCQRHEWNAIQDFLRSLKIRDLVLTHPITLSNSSGNTRLELWDRGVFQLDRNGNLEHLNHSTSNTSRWAAEFGYESVEQAFQSTPVLVAPDREPAEAGNRPTQLIDLGDADVLEGWLCDTAVRLNELDAGDIPLIRQVRQSNRNAGTWLLRVAAMLAVVGFCGWHLAWLNSGTDTVMQQTRALEVPGIEKQKFDALTSEVLQQRESAIENSVKTKAQLQRVRFFFENQTDRLNTLLTKLVQFRTNDLVIKGISLSEKGTVVSGVSLDSDAAPLLTSRLRDTVTSAGWKIHPANQQGTLKMINGGPWDFSILLEDVGPPSLLRETATALVERKKSGDPRK